MDRIRQLRLADFVPPGGCFHALRRHPPQSSKRAVRTPLHCHDFVEAFWIERGVCVYVLGNTAQELSAGDLVLVRPEDAHGFAATGRDGYTMVNVAFASEELNGVRQRLYPGKTAFPWDSGLPARRRLSTASLARFRSWGDRLGRMRQERVEFEAFLLDLLATCGSDSEQVADEGPAWFVAAVREFSLSDHLEEGLPALLRLCGRSGEHVNRTCRRHRGTTATALINEMRLEHAAGQLRETDDSILSIALACGFNNLGYFYRLFHARFGDAPRHWRQRQRQGIGLV